VLETVEAFGSTQEHKSLLWSLVD